MTTVKTIASVVPGVMALGLLGNSMKLLPPKKGKSAKPGKILKVFGTTMIGIPLISATSGMVSKL